MNYSLLKKSRKKLARDVFDVCHAYVTDTECWYKMAELMVFLVYIVVIDSHFVVVLDLFVVVDVAVVDVAVVLCANLNCKFIRNKLSVYKKYSQKSVVYVCVCVCVCVCVLVRACVCVCVCVC